MFSQNYAVKLLFKIGLIRRTSQLLKSPVFLFQKF